MDEKTFKKIAQKLKKNTTPHALLDEEAKLVFQYVGEENCEFFVPGKTSVWHTESETTRTGKFVVSRVYRIKEEYQQDAGMYDRHRLVIPDKTVGIVREGVFTKLTDVVCDHGFCGIFRETEDGGEQEINIELAARVSYESYVKMAKLRELKDDSGKG